jgi:hypothetical protein
LPWPCGTFLEVSSKWPVVSRGRCFRDIDIIKIESRPALVSANTITSVKQRQPVGRAFTQKHWDLIFYVDYEPSNDEAVNTALLNNLKEFSLWLRELGSYRSSLQRIEAKTNNWSEVLDVMAIG